MVPEYDPVTYCWGRLAEITDVTAEERFARDEDELLVLAGSTGIGQLVVRDHA